MRHLRKAFSTHRLIRSQPETNSADTPPSASSATDQDIYDVPTATSLGDTHWQRKRPWHAGGTSPESSLQRLIALWDETEETYSKKV